MDFVLRPWSLNDLPDLIRHADNPKIAANLTDAFPHPYTQEDGENFLARATAGSPANYQAITVAGHAAGGIGLHFQTDIMRRNLEIGYWLAEAYWGQGIMRRAVRQMTTFGFVQWPEIQRIFARPFGYNLASQRVLQSAGYVFEARFTATVYKNEQFQDELFYATTRDTWQG